MVQVLSFTSAIHCPNGVRVGEDTAITGNFKLHIFNDGPSEAAVSVVAILRDNEGHERRFPQNVTVSTHGNVKLDDMLRADANYRTLGIKQWSLNIAISGDLTTSFQTESEMSILGN
ncbi:hypothetical protein [Singulisphaera sp. GP187]|uniref:hypothetical protein n=1 Tax=Singulisphaera sp. GP187 TaxID=1882752 RepID=UPI0011610794|nr:hypothetical protein [Singulisphaera sp. GP187]